METQQLTQLSFTRGGKQYNQYVGTNEQGNSVLYIDCIDLDNLTSQPVRYYPKELSIKFDTSSGTGNVAYIYTEWEEALIGNNGNPIPNTGKSKSMKTNPVDQASFITKFGLPILMSMDNGFIRAILGFNNLPIFNTVDGSIISYTEEQENELPTNDY